MINMKYIILILFVPTAILMLMGLIFKWILLSFMAGYHCDKQIRDICKKIDIGTK